MWQLGRETVRLLVKDERGVIKIRLGRKKAHTIYSVPRIGGSTNPHPPALTAGRADRPRRVGLLSHQLGSTSSYADLALPSLESHQLPACR